MRYDAHGKVMQTLVPRIVNEVYYLGDSTLRDCPYFNTGKSVTDADIAAYFSNHHQIRIMESDELQHPTLAMTVKLPRESDSRSRFSILLNKREIGLAIPMPLECGFARLRILGHELGHVFLHAKHQEPGTLSVFRSDGRCHRTPFHSLADLQSDVFALVLLIGDWMIRNHLGSLGNPAPTLMDLGQCADRLAIRYRAEVGHELPIAAARDRIRIFGMRQSLRIPGPFEYIGQEGPFFSGSQAA